MYLHSKALSTVALILSCQLGLSACPFVNDLIAGESPSIPTVNNVEQGLWDSEAGKHLHVTETLSIGVVEGDQGYVLGRVFDIATDSTGAIYVLDNGFHHVKKYTKGGVFEATIGQNGDGPGEFRFPLALTVDSSGRLYVADISKVCVFDKNGEFVEEWRHSLSGGVPTSIRRTANGDYLLTCFDVFEQKVMHRFSSDHSAVQSFCDSYAAGQEVDVRAEQTFSGGAFDIAENGLIYYTQRHPYEIRVFSEEGTLLRRIYRDTDFMLPTKARYEGEGFTVGLPTSSYSIVLLRDGNFINVVRRLPEPVMTMIDLFDRDGQLLTSHRYDRAMNIRSRDDAGHLYGVDETDFPRVVKYAISYGDD